MNLIILFESVQDTFTNGLMPFLNGKALKTKKDKEAFFILLNSHADWLTSV